MRQHPTRARFTTLALTAVLGLTWSAAFVATPALAGDKPDAPAPPAPSKEAKGKAKAKDAPRADLAGLEKKLSADEDTAVATLQEMAEKADPETVPLVARLLARGSTPKVLDAALKTAAKLKAEPLSAAIAPYVQHRTEEIRRGAVKALLKTKGSAAVAALRNALKSSDAVVRGTAATGLGTLGTKEALPDLFKAFDHGVAEAGASIGQLCTPEQCETFAERTGKVAFDIMVTGFDQILFRAPTDIPDEEKIRLIGRMRELGTPEVGKYLADVGDRWPKDWSTKLKQAIDSAARAIGAGAKK